MPGDTTIPPTDPGDIAAAQPAGRHHVARRVSPRLIIAAIAILIAAAVLIAVRGGDEEGLPNGSASRDEAAGDVTGVGMSGAAPADIDLTAVDVAFADGQGQITFRAAGPAQSDELTRAWVWRAWAPGDPEPRITVFVQGGVGATPFPDTIIACEGSAFCSEKADGATFTRAGDTATLTLPAPIVKRLPPHFTWAAATYARPRPTSNNRWQDETPDGGFTADPPTSASFRSVED